MPREVVLSSSDLSEFYSLYFASLLGPCAAHTNTNWTINRANVVTSLSTLPSSAMGSEELVSPATTSIEHNQNDDLESQPETPETNTINSAEPPYSIFSKRKRVFIIIMATICASVSPLSGNIYFPALNVLSAELHVSSSLINISLTTYMVFQGLAPAFMGDLADSAGRRPAFVIGFIIYIGACIGLALQTSFAALLVLRCLQSTGSSSTVALASGIAADVSTAAERGTNMGWVNAGALLGPAIGPILGE